MSDRLPTVKTTGRLRLAAGFGVGMLIALATVVSVGPSGAEPRRVAVESATSHAAARTARNVARFADLRGIPASADVKYIGDWVADSRDAGGAPFVIVDKKGARVYVFDAAARLLGASPVLLGSAKGDDTVPGIGDKPLSQVLPAERTTPAGRFVGERGHNARGEDVVWVDYDAAVSMHRVLTTNKAERRLERLATPAVDDNRVSFGCINVPVAFYESLVRPTFAGNTAIIYVLPEVKSLKQVFGAYDVAAAHGIHRSQVQRVPDSDALLLLLFALRN